MTATLARTHDLRALVPGDTATARDLARRLDRQGESYEVTGHLLRQIDTVGAWQGTAAERSRATIGALPAGSPPPPTPTAGRPPR